MSQAAQQLPATAAVRAGSVEHWAQTRPDVVAFVEGARTLTWRETNEQADRLAAALAARGVKAGDVIGVRTQIRIEWPVIDAALAKLGATVLGMNWRLTPAEVEYVLGDSGAAGLICDDPHPELLLPALSGCDLKATISIDAEATGFANWRAILATPADAPRLSRQPAGLVIYTSGTTGRPKGVGQNRITPANAARVGEYYASIAARSPRGMDDVILCTMPFSHGAGPGLVRGGVNAGATMILQRRFDPIEVLELIRKHRVTIWTGVPTMLKRIAALGDAAMTHYDLSSMRALHTGAAPVPPSLKQWARRHFGETLHEAYGATEVGMIAHLTPDMQKVRPASSGYPYRHVEVSVRDQRGRELPAGAAGELWIRTPVTIRNYLNAPGLGRDTLDADGFFRVGDVGYVDEEGYIFTTARMKDMIISGGVNIYPAEIEAVLIRHPAVQDVAVIGVPDEEFGESVKAFVEIGPGATLAEGELAAFAREALASYKRPKSIDIVDELPRNTMGKILKRELRAPYWKDRDRQV